MSFDNAFEYTMPFEGWSAYTNDKDDPGGPTKYGITLGTLQASKFDVDGDGTIDAGDVKILTPSDAKGILKGRYWDKVKADEIESERIAIKLFDCAVNMGPFRAIKLAQEALNHIGCGLVVDGLIGPKTIGCLNSSDEDVFFLFLISELESFYSHIVSEKPEMRKYYKGWLRRARTLPKVE